ncbi:MAG: pilus assembly protein TadG-related protein [Pseudomonadota bacterium]
MLSFNREGVLKRAEITFQWPSRSRFASDQRGVVVIIFAMILVPVLGIISLSIDYGRASHTETIMQKALDAGVVAAQRSSPATKSRLEAEFHGSFRANLPDHLKTVQPSINFDLTRNVVRASAKVSVPTTLMAMVGRKELNVGVRSAGRLNAVVAKRKSKPVQRRLTKRAPVRPSAARASSPQQIDQQQLREAIRQAMSDPRITPEMRRRLEVMIGRH